VVFTFTVKGRCPGGESGRGRRGDTQLQRGSGESVAKLIGRGVVSAMGDFHMGHAPVVVRSVGVTHVERRCQQRQCRDRRKDGPAAWKQ
jgi:hypothetical protein